MRKMINSLALQTNSEEEIGGTCSRLGRQTSDVRSLEGIEAYGKQKPSKGNLSWLPKIVSSCLGK